MPLVSQSVDSLIQGVSQQSHPQRLTSQVEDQVNCIDSVTDGKIKRPPTKHVAKLSSMPGNYNSARVHTINRDASHRYRCVFINGDLQIFDMAGNAVACSFPNGKAYLNTATPSSDIRCATIGDTTVVINRSQITAKDATKKAPAALPGVLVWVRQVDFATNYSISLGGFTETYQTPIGSGPDVRSQIATDTIAAALMAKIQAAPELSAFTVQQFGSTLYITRTDGADFSVSVTDGLGDNALFSVKDSIQRFEDLPPRAPKGFVVEVTGDPTNAFDNYYVVYDDQGNPAQDGVWRECVKPGSLIALNADTMPHVLVLGGDLSSPEACTGNPPMPAVDAAGAAAVYNSWDTNIDDTAGPGADLAIGTTVSPLIENHNTGVRSVGCSFNGTTSHLEVRYNLDMTTATSAATVALYAETSPGSGVWTTNPIASLPYPSKGMFNNQVLIVDPVTYAAGTKLKLKLLYAGGQIVSKGTWPEYSLAKLYPLNFPVTGSPPPAGIAITTDRKKRITFDPAQVYPIGTIVSMFITGTNSDASAYTVTGTDATGATVVTALIAHLATIGGGLTFPTTLISPGVFEIGPPALSPLNIVNVSVIPVPDNSKTALLMGSGFTPGAFVGDTIKNVTDGSTGVVTANGANSIQVSSLTGGSSNVFNVGDSVVIAGSAASFVFKPATWNARAAGDDVTVPFPSFIGKTINTVFGFAGRIIFTSQENIIASAAGDVFNFFRQSATNLLDADMIDVSAASQKISFFYSVVSFREQLYLFSDQGQYILSGDPFLSPKTVALGLVTQYPSSILAEPVNSGVRVFFTRTVGPSTRVMEFLRDWRTREDSANDVTKQVPTYLVGNPVVIAADGSQSLLAVLTDANAIYIYADYVDATSGQQLQESWGRWTLAPGSTILSMDIVDFSMGLVVKTSDGLYLNTLDLNFSDTTPQAHIDRRTSFATGTYSSPNTTWTLPYSVAVDGSAGEVVVVRQDTLAEIPSTRPTATTVAVTGDFHAVPVYVGIRYTMSFTLSTIYMRQGQNAKAITNGRLQMNYMVLSHDNTGKFTVVVTPQGRAPYTYVYTGPDSGDLPGQFTVPLQARNLNLGIVISDNSVTDARFSGYDWEGRFTIRSKNV